MPKILVTPMKQFGTICFCGFVSFACAHDQIVDLRFANCQHANQLCVSEGRASFQCVDSAAGMEYSTGAASGLFDSDQLVYVVFSNIDKPKRFCSNLGDRSF